ncbi:immune inhibitor A domain-containing protein [Thalassotalea piscium]
MKLSMICSLLLVSAVACPTVATPFSQTTSPSDPGVINQERILYWLAKRGELPLNADEQMKKRAIDAYLNKKSFEKKTLPKVLSKRLAKAERLRLKDNKRLPRVTVKGYDKVSALSSSTVNNDVETRVKVLAILIDFPDLKYNTNGLSASDTNMYYSDYSVQHYNDLLFSETGYPGPSGQNILSSYQYYQQESGGTFMFTGEAHGWVTADHDAEYYGGNDEDNDNDDKNVPALVTEAVAKAVSELKIDLTEYDQVDTYDFDNDGVINEPDGIIDHVMIFHSSVGEEAGGGVLAEDAIWSHRFFVYGDDTRQNGVSIPDSSVRLFGYTINPIDAATGVTVHEFGHDLGLDDEYDTDNGALGSPVGDWSVMASGSWLGSPSGTSPATFSALARDYLSQKYQGNWISQLEVDFSTLKTEDINLVAANNHQNGINQVKVNLPPKKIAFGDPLAGSYQYYSGKENQQDNRLLFSLNLPSEAATLTMAARWNIEEDWDYAQILVNGTAIAGSHTKATNAVHSSVTHYISGNSEEVTERYGALSWVDLSFDLAAYAGQNVTIEIRYKTDEAVLKDGFIIDNLQVKSGGNELFFSGGESENELQLEGFSRITDAVEGKGHNYYIQLRDYSGTDAKLANIGYQPGVLLWYRDENVGDNQVNNHPGEVFIGVVDADQYLIQQGIITSGTSTQIRDATFSLYDQSYKSGDGHLTNNALFSDLDDYSAPSQPESGIKLPSLGFMMEVISQNVDSNNATVTLSNQDSARIESVQTGLSVTLTLLDEKVSANSNITWAMGDGTQLTGKTVTHLYSEAGKKPITVTYMTSSEEKTLEKELIVAQVISGSVNANITDKQVEFTTTLMGGYGEFVYQWDFGDGRGTSDDASPSYTYQQQGTYDVQLIVTDETKNSVFITKAIEIIDPLTAAISSTRNNLTVSLQAAASGGDQNYTYQWDLGDNTTAQGQSISHTYSQSGTYSVKLSVTDGEGVSVETSVSLSVSAAVTSQPKPASSSGGAIGIYALLCLLLLRVFTLKKVNT